MTESMETNEIIVSANEIHREFATANGVLSVLKGISIDVRRKEMAALLGASGAGKSTLLHLLSGLDRPTRGEIVVDGKQLNKQSEKQLAHFRNEKIGFIFQFHYLMEDFDALENVMMPVLIAGVKKNDASIKAEQLLELVGLKDRMKHFPSQLSGGEQQRVAVARALVNDPEIVLADEPSGNLDTSTGRKLHELLFHLNSENDVTFLIATHNRELAESCGRRLEIVDGRISE